MKLDHQAVEAAYDRAVDVMGHDVPSRGEFVTIIKAYEAARLGFEINQDFQEIIGEQDGDQLYITGTSIDRVSKLWRIDGLMAFGKVHGSGWSREAAIGAAIAHGKKLESQHLDEC